MTEFIPDNPEPGTLGVILFLDNPTGGREVKGSKILPFVRPGVLIGLHRIA